MLVIDKSIPTVDPGRLLSHWFWSAIPPRWEPCQKECPCIVQWNTTISALEQFHILRHIRTQKGGVRGAEVKHISCSAVSQAVDILEARGLIY